MASLGNQTMTSLARFILEFKSYSLLLLNGNGRTCFRHYQYNDSDEALQAHHFRDPFSPMQTSKTWRTLAEGRAVKENRVPAGEFVMFCESVERPAVLQQYP